MIIRMRRLWLALAVAVLALVAASVLATTPAAAHSDLVSSTPANGSTLVQPPAEVVFTFNENISTAGLQVVAQGPAGTVGLAPAAVNGVTVSAAWPQDADDGEFRVSFRVVSADGHPIDGSVQFTVGAPGPGGSAAPTTDPGTGAAAPASVQTEESGSGFPLWIPIVVVIVGVAIGATIARVMRGRSGSTPAG